MGKNYYWYKSSWEKGKIDENHLIQAVKYSFITEEQKDSIMGVNGKVIEKCPHNHHDNCICKIINTFIKSEKPISIRTNSGDEIIGEIICFDPCANCVTILQPEMISPKLPAIGSVISCTDIESISFETKQD